MAITSSIIPSFRSPIIGGGLFSRARSSNFIRPKISNMRSMIDGLKPIIKSPIGEGGVFSRASNFIRPKISNVGSMINNLRPNTDQRGQGESKGRFLSNFMGFGSKRNEKKIKKSMKLLRNTLVETFEIAKILRVAVKKVAEQLKGLAANKGGGGLLGGGIIGNLLNLVIGGALTNWLGETFFPETTDRIKGWVGNAVSKFMEPYMPWLKGAGIVTALFVASNPRLATKVGLKGIKYAGLPIAFGAGVGLNEMLKTKDGDVNSVGIAPDLLSKFNNILDKFSDGIKSFVFGTPVDGKNYSKEGDVSFNTFSNTVTNTSSANNLINNSTTNNNISKHIDNIKNGTSKTNVTFVPYNVNTNNNQPSAVSPIINPSSSPNNSEDFAFYTAHNPDSYSDFETKLMYNIVEA